MIVFISKVTCLTAGMAEGSSCDLKQTELKADHQLTAFAFPSVDEVMDSIKKAPSKQRCLNLMATSVVETCSLVLVPLFLDIVCSSLSSGVVRISL